MAELVREQLLVRARDELPHSIACRVTEWEWPRIRCEILVERDSQKGIVIGRGGEVLKAVGTAVRAELPAGAYLELFVRVEKRWQQRDDARPARLLTPGSATRRVGEDQRRAQELLHLAAVGGAPHGRHRGQQHPR